MSETGKWRTPMISINTGRTEGDGFGGRGTVDEQDTPATAVVVVVSTSFRRSGRNVSRGVRSDKALTTLSSLMAEEEDSEDIIIYVVYVLHEKNHLYREGGGLHVQYVGWVEDGGLGFSLQLAQNLSVVSRGNEDKDNESNDMAANDFSKSAHSDDPSARACRTKSTRMRSDTDNNKKM
jgi:hypothetical protein